ncbi:MAG: anaerobic ribonucleoside-triphosphate reductase activating protein [bacterium]|nr:anaerobic ribonucleoside-triphosphate reductase activating protein [bacterium]
MSELPIGGFQKLSLVDYPGRPCSIIFTQGCVFTCGYCHNPELIPFTREGRLSEEDVIGILEKQRTIVESVCITGGEPTLHKGLIPFLRRLKVLGFNIKLDTNGNNPSAIEVAVEDKLVDYIAMDIKAPWEKYMSVIGRGAEQKIERCRRTFSLIQESDIDHEFRTTIHSAHTENDFIEMCEYLSPGERYFIQDTQYIKTLDPNFLRSALQATMLQKSLRSMFPHLKITAR